MTVKWERLARLTLDAKSVTGSDSDKAEAAVVRAAERMDELRSQPLIVLVCDETGTCEVAERLEEKVWTDKNVSIATKAFRMVKMSPAAAAEEPLLKGLGKADPRLIFLDVARDKSVVLEGRRVKVRPIYSAMKKISKPFYKESIHWVVRKHVKLIAEFEKLYPRRNALRTRLAAVDDESSAADKLRKKLEAVEKSQAALREREAALWELTPRKAKSSAGKKST